MYNRDIKFRQYNDVIPQEDLRTFQQRLKELVAFVRDRFPDAKPLWIDSHWLNPNDLNVRHACELECYCTSGPRLMISILAIATRVRSVLPHGTAQSE